MEHRDYLEHLQSSCIYNICKDSKDKWLVAFNEKAYKYFNRLTDKDPGYYSDEALEYIPSIRQEIGEFCNTHTWEEVFDLYLNRIITGMKLAHTNKIGYTTGNSQPSQFGFYGGFFKMCIFDKMIHECNIIVDNDEKTSLSYLTFETWKDIGYGHTVKASIKCHFDMDVTKDNRLCCNVHIYSKHDKDYHPEFDDIAAAIRKKFKDYKKKDWFKMNLKEKKTFPETSL